MARSRASDYDDKRRRILDTAAVVLAQVGPEKASMAEIARHAGTSKALLYHYYTSKDALVYDIICTHLNELDAVLTGVDKNTEAANKRLENLVLAVLVHYKNAESKHQVLLTCMQSLSSEQADQVRHIERLIVRRFSTVLSLVNPALGSAETNSLMPVTMSLFGMLNWMYTWFRDDGSMSREQYAQMVTTVFLGGVGALQ